MKSIFTIYLILIHIFIGIVIVKTDLVYRIQEKFGLETTRSELTPQYYTMLAFHKRVDKNIADNSVIFIGDSLIQGLAVSAVYPKSVNFGIGFDTTQGVLNRIHQYSAIARAKALVIAIGINDLSRRTNKEIIQNYLKIIDAVPSTTIVFSSILPVDETVSKRIGQNARIGEINKRLQDICKNRSQLHFLDMTPFLINSYGSLSNEYHIGDGVHLNGLGNGVWIAQLKETLQKVITNNEIE